MGEGNGSMTPDIRVSETVSCGVLFYSVSLLFAIKVRKWFTDMGWSLASADFNSMLNSGDPSYLSSQVQYTSHPKLQLDRAEQQKFCIEIFDTSEN